MDAASCLMQGQYYTESIHCVYYACYQMLLYRIDDLFDKNERERKSDYDAYVYNRSINRGRFLGSHDFWIKFFQEKMQEKSKMTRFSNGVASAVHSGSQNGHTHTGNTAGNTAGQAVQQLQIVRLLQDLGGLHVVS